MSLNENLRWIEALAELRSSGTPCAVVVVTDVQGSAPREAGARMIVAGGRLVSGTIGGGNLEHQAIEHATRLLEGGEPVSQSVRYPLAESVGQCCGGAVVLFYETYPWTPRRLVVFGAGHVGQAIGGLADYLGVRTTLIDPRDEDELQPRPPADRAFELECIDAPEAEVDGLPAGTLVLVMTHSHALDLEVVAKALRRTDLAYLGLIGSERKWQRFRKRLLERGFTEDDLARVTCPIGVSKRSKEPRAIAISVAAELLDVMHAPEGDAAVTPASSPEA